MAIVCVVHEAETQLLEEHERGGGEQDAELINEKARAARAIHGEIVLELFDPILGSRFGGKSRLNAAIWSAGRVIRPPVKISSTSVWPRVAAGFVRAVE